MTSPGKHPRVRRTADPSTCEGLPDLCAGCIEPCFAALAAEPFDDDCDGPDLWTGPGEDFVLWAETMRR
jgi:hypothetical protein